MTATQKVLEKIKVTKMQNKTHVELQDGSLALGIRKFVFGQKQDTYAQNLKVESGPCTVS